MAGPEARLRTRIVKALNEHGGYWFVTHQTQYGQVGIADILGVYHGYFFALEVKRPGHLHTLTVNQDRFLARVKRNKGRAIVVTSVDEAMNFVYGQPL
jgi:penicillin-binding protein-related factor A (putative recombinase)